MKITDQVNLKINGMHCASCVNSIESGLTKLDGIDDCQVNLALNSAQVSFLPSKTNKNSIIKEIEKLGFEAEIGIDNIFESNRKQTDKAIKSFKISLLLSIPLMIFSMTPMFMSEFIIDYLSDGLIQATLAALILFGAGYDIVKDAFIQLKYFRANMNSLVTMGTLTAFIWSLFVLYQYYMTNKVDALYFESAGMIITLILLGRLLEAHSKGKAGEAIESLIKLKPAKTLAIINNVEIEIDTASAQVGMILLVKPGERIPADGEIIENNPVIDESLLTGESMPVEKKVGEPVIGGALNGNTSFKMKVTVTGENSFLPSIIRLVSEAQSKKANVQKLADKVALVFVPIVIIIAILTFTFWYFYDPDSPMLIKGIISVLIIACPCALGLATPTAILAGTGRAAKEGIIIRGGDVLENITKIDTIMFDKTGTLTTGRLTVIDVITLGHISKRQITKLVGSAESQSEHPIAKAVVKHMKFEQIKPVTIRGVEALPGFGIKAEYENKPLLIGNKALMNNEKIDISNVIDKSKIEMDQGHSVVFVALDHQVCGYLVLSDKLRSESSELITKLKELSYKVMMISGDTEKTASGIAKIVGIDEFVAEIRPEQKKFIVESCRRSDLNVAMVGDGINDAPALAMANVGIAIGTGTDIAIESSDVVLIRSNLMNIIKMFSVSKKSLQIIKQNLFWAFCYNIIAIPLAAGLFYPLFGLSLSPIIAAAAMAFSSVFVVSNSLRLNKLKL